jgi:excisionase family DNA binding protein
MEKLLTSKELAQAIGASESSMRRWTNSGAIRTARTVGGHRRISVSEAIRFVRESGATLVRPEFLGLPQLPATPEGIRLGSRSLELHLYEALLKGDASAAKGCVAGLFLKGSTVASICDGAMESAMRRIGEIWQQDVRGILIEHRAMSICVQSLEVLRQMVGEPPNNAPVALGGAPAGDPYLLPSMMAAAVMAESGYRDMNFGPDTPLALLADAAEENKAGIVWLSVKVVADRPKLRREIGDLADRLNKLDIKLAIGGGGVESLSIRPTRNVHIMGTMTELAAFARGAADSSGAEDLAHNNPGSTLK